jgi:hypothetical protein
MYSGVRTTNGWKEEYGNSADNRQHDEFVSELAI